MDSHALPAAPPTAPSAAATGPYPELDPRVEALVNELIGRVADKWTMLVLDLLAEKGEMRFTRIAELAGYFQAHGTVGRVAAENEAIVAIGKIVHRQVLIMAFSDAFAVVGVVLVVAAIALIFTRKVGVGAGAAGGH